MLPGPAVPGCCLNSFHFMRAIHPIRPVQYHNVWSNFAPSQTQPGVIVVVDNTFESAYFQKPLNLGADVTYYSCTKVRNCLTRKPCMLNLSH